MKQAGSLTRLLSLSSVQGTHISDDVPPHEAVIDALLRPSSDDRMMDLLS